MKALVTGGAGFIGSHLVNKLLRKGYDVIALDNLKRGNKIPREDLQRIRFVEGDVRNQSLVYELVKECDTVFHLAAILGVDMVADNPVETMETEISGLLNVAKAAIRYNVGKLVYSSTSGVYGKAAIEKAVDEDFCPSPSSSYAIAKRYNEIFLKALYQEKQLQSVSLRYFNIYGPRQDSRMVIPRFLEQAIHGQPITVFGNGQQTRDFTYVEDAVEATVLAAEKIEGCEIVNVASSHEYTIADLAERIVKMTGSSSKITQVNPPSGRYDFEVQRRIGCSGKLESLTAFLPTTELDYGLRCTIEAYLKRKPELSAQEA